jgi:hypothetical protein
VVDAPIQKITLTQGIAFEPAELKRGQMQDVFNLGALIDSLAELVAVKVGDQLDDQGGAVMKPGLSVVPAPVPVRDVVVPGCTRPRIRTILSLNDQRGRSGKYTHQLGPLGPEC